VATRRISQHMTRERVMGRGSSKGNGKGIPGGSGWWDRAGAKIVNRPDESVETIRERATTALLKTVKSGRALRVPKVYASRMCSLYNVAKRQGYAMQAQTDGKFVYYRWVRNAKA